VQAQHGNSLFSVLERFNFAPLAYGDDAMVTRHLKNGKLQKLAARFGGSIIDELVTPVLPFTPKAGPMQPSTDMAPRPGG
jgi:hypothetical protein